MRGGQREVGRRRAGVRTYKRRGEAWRAAPRIVGRPNIHAEAKGHFAAHRKRHSARRRNKPSIHRWESSVAYKFDEKRRSGAIDRRYTAVYVPIGDDLRTAPIRSPVVKNKSAQSAIGIPPRCGRVPGANRGLSDHKCNSSKNQKSAPSRSAVSAFGRCPGNQRSSELRNATARHRRAPVNDAPVEQRQDRHSSVDDDDLASCGRPPRRVPHAQELVNRHRRP